LFSPYGEIEKIKKLRDYAFIHYKERQGAVDAMEGLKGMAIDDVEVEISLAKPQSDNKSKKKITSKRGMPMMGAGPRGNYGGQNMRGRGNFGGPGFGKPYSGPGGYDSYGSSYQSAPPQAPYYDPYAYQAYPDPYAQSNSYGYGAPSAVSSNRVYFIDLSLVWLWRFRWFWPKSRPRKWKFSAGEWI
jgi:RNA recognition motif-containing protein